MLVASDHAWSRNCGTALATMISPAASQPLSTLDANGYTMPPSVGKMVSLASVTGSYQL